MNEQAARWSRLWRWTIPASVRQSPEELRRARLILLISAFSVGLGLFFLLQLMSQPGRAGTRLVILIGTLLFGVKPWLLSKELAPRAVGAAVVVEFTVVFMLSAYLNGGLVSTAIWWNAALPLMASILVGPQAGLWVTLVILCEFVAFYVLSLEPSALPEPPQYDRNWMTFLSSSAVVSLCALVAWHYEKARRQAMEGARNAAVILEKQNIRLIEATRKAQSAAVAKGQFVANVSHEIRTPLHGIVGLTSLLVDTPLSPEQREMIREIRASSDVLSDLVLDLLDFSRLESGKALFTPRVIDLWEVAENCTVRAVESTERKAVDVAWLVEQDVPRWIRADPKRIQQVLVNLVENALKFTDVGSVSLHVRLVPGRAEGTMCLECEVLDTGLGMALEDVERLFEPFVQGDPSPSREYGGTGLGLAIARQLTLQLKGEIGAERRPQGGSRFWVRLPVEEADEPASEKETDPLAGQCVILALRNPYRRLQCKMAMERWGIDVESHTELDTLASRLKEDVGSISAVLLDESFQDQPAVQAGLASAEHGWRECAILLLESRTFTLDKVVTPLLKRARILVTPLRLTQLYRVLGTALGVLDIPTRSLGLQSQGASPQPTGPRPLLLLAEDHPVNQQVAVRALERAGWDVDIADNGLEALKAFSMQDYVAVLMDCHMPELDGYEATRRIRETESPGKHIPIIAMTASAMQGDRERCLEAGMDDYLSKPVEPAELVRLVERWSGKPGQHSEDAPQERNQSLFQSDSLAALRDYQKEGEPCFRAKLVSVFLESSSLLRETMRVAFEEQRYADLAECAHQLKSSSAVVGAEALSALCQTLEDRGRAGDASQLQKLLLRFDELLSAVSDELQSAVSEELTALSSTERTEND